MIESLHELQALTVDDSAAGDPHIARVLRQHDVPSALLDRVVLQSRPAEESRARFDVQNDAGFEADRRGQVGAATREGDVAGCGAAAVDRWLDGGGVVGDAVSSGAKVGDGESGGEVVWELDGGCWRGGDGVEESK